MSAPANHCKCKTSHKVKPRGKPLSVLAGILIVILPKCPFCILAYSSAITLCSGAKVYNHAPNWASWISIGLAGLTLLLVLWNYKGYRTLSAAALILLGSYFILTSELQTGDLADYYLGATLLLGGIWVNGSFQYIVNRWGRPLWQRFFFLSKKQA